MTEIDDGSGGVAPAAPMRSTSAQRSLDRRQVRVRVQLALFMVADLHRNRRLVADASYFENLTSLVLAVLLDTSVPEDSST